MEHAEQLLMLAYVLMLAVLVNIMIQLIIVNKKHNSLKIILFFSL